MSEFVLCTFLHARTYPHIHTHIIVNMRLILKISRKISPGIFMPFLMSLMLMFTQALYM